MARDFLGPEQVYENLAFRMDGTPVVVTHIGRHTEYVTHKTLDGSPLSISPQEAWLVGAALTGQSGRGACLPHRGTTDRLGPGKSGLSTTAASPPPSGISCAMARRPAAAISSATAASASSSSALWDARDFKGRCPPRKNSSRSMIAGLQAMPSRRPITRNVTQNPGWSPIAQAWAGFPAGSSTCWRTMVWRRSTCCSIHAARAEAGRTDLGRPPLSRPAGPRQNRLRDNPVANSGIPGRSHEGPHPGPRSGRQARLFAGHSRGTPRRKLRVLAAP